MKKRILFFALSLVMFFNFSSPLIHALDIEYSSEHSYSDNNVIVDDSSIEVDGYVYKDEELDSVLENIELVSNNVDYSEFDSISNLEYATITPRVAPAIPLLLPGIYYVVGIGKIVVTAAKTIIIGSTVVSVGTILWKKITSFIVKYNWNKSVDNAIIKCNCNKKGHILKQKDDWNEFFKKPSWSNVSPLIAKALKEDSEKHEKSNVYLRTIYYKGEQISVRFIKDSKGLVQALSTAWVVRK